MLLILHKDVIGKSSAGTPVVNEQIIRSQSERWAFVKCCYGFKAKLTPGGYKIQHGSGRLHKSSDEIIERCHRRDHLGTIPKTTLAQNCCGEN